MKGKFFISGNNILEVVGISEKDILGKTNIYEVIRVIDGVALFKEEHLDRMRKSLGMTEYCGKIKIEDVSQKIEDIIRVNGNENGNIKVIINKDEDEIYLYYVQHSYPTEDMYRKGVDTILYNGERNNPNAKIIDNNFREQVNKQIKDNGVYEAILVDKDGNLTEGSKSNIFMVKNETLITSPINKVLPGVTRGKIIELAKELKIDVEERNINKSEIADLDGMFISGTSPKILPIRKINGIKKFQKNNTIITKLVSNFNKKIEKYINLSKKI